MACRNSADAEKVELLIDAGANIDFRSIDRYDNRKSDYLGDGDADSDSEDESCCCIEPCICVPDSCKPAILMAAENKNWEVVKLLLEEGAAVTTNLKKCPPKVLDHELKDTAGV
jgi:ankyrin repeat protein